MYESAIVVASEIALALYPILIKSVPTSLFTQVFSRFLTYTVLGIALAKPGELATAVGLSGIGSTIGLSLLNLLHVGSSYFAFKELPAGISMSLFYTYPIFNVLFAALFFGESVSAYDIALIVLAFTGVVLVSMGNKSEDTKDPYNWKGLLAGLTAALTETLIYFSVKSVPTKTPFFSMIKLYSAGAVMLAGGSAFTGTPIDFNGSVWLPMILFNTFIGFIGYCLRFYAIPLIPTVIFSLLTFIGILASFGWGYLFVGEVPSTLSAIGAAVITAAVGLSRNGHM
jgi:drug/metabolite transporter (DMT)-like permease